MTPTIERLLVARRVVTCDGPRDAEGLARLGVIEAGAVGIRAGRIAWVGPAAQAPAAASVVDLGERLLMPGLVDPHTHLVFGGSRVEEFARRMAGEDYRAIAAAGGGIAATVRGTRALGDDALFEASARRARALRAHGVTTAEVKSGYGLTFDDELRCLSVGRRLEAEGILRTTTTFLGAHAVPPERRHDRGAYLDDVVDSMLPAAAERGLADSVDVYCDDGAFTLAEARRVLEAAKARGLAVRGHVGQFVDLGGPQLLAELGALSADHLEAVSDAGLSALAKAHVVAVLLPGAWRTLRQEAPDAARMRAAGVTIAVGTDLNPGTSPTSDLPACAALAVRDAGLTLEEAVLAITANAAKAAGVADVGRLVVGAHADLVAYELDDPRALAYALGGTRASALWLAGEAVPLMAGEDTIVW